MDQWNPKSLFNKARLNMGGQQGQEDEFDIKYSSGRTLTPQNPLQMRIFTKEERLRPDSGWHTLQ